MDRADQRSLRTVVAGNIRMTTLVLALAITGAQILLALAMGCAAFRILRGPRAQDRVLGMDSPYIAGMLLFLTYGRSEEHTSELQSLMRISYALFCWKKKNH